MQDGEQPPQELILAPVARRSWIRKVGLVTISVSSLVLLVCVQESLAHLLVPTDIGAEASPPIVNPIMPAGPQPLAGATSTIAEPAAPSPFNTIDPFEDDYPSVREPEEETVEPENAAYVRMPDFLPLRYGEARRQARELGLQIRRRGEIPTVHTQVYRQSVEAGTLVAPGSEVSVYLRDPHFNIAVAGY